VSTSRPSLVPGAEETRLVQTLFFNEASSRVHTDILVWGQDCSWLCDWSLSHYHREEPPKPTTGLEYTYGRRSRGANIVRINCKLLHSWGCSQACTPTVPSFSTRMSVGPPVQDYLSAHTTSNETIFLRPTQRHPLCGTCFRQYQPRIILMLYMININFKLPPMM